MSIKYQRQTIGVEKKLGFLYVPAQGQEYMPKKNGEFSILLQGFYVACSRAKQSLAIVAYSANPNAVEETILKNGWFNKDKIEIIA